MPKLVIERSVSESTYIKHPDGTVVVVTLERIEPTKVRISFEAPRQIQIVRDDAKNVEPKP